MSSPDEVRGLIPAQRNGEGPDSARFDGFSAADHRGRVRVLSTDFDLGAWFDPDTLPDDAETDRP